MVAVLAAGVGMFIVAYWGARPVALGIAGTITGLGVAATHFLGMAAMPVNGTVHYRSSVVVLSVALATGAAIAGLWSAVSVRGFLASLVAGLMMAVAISGRKAVPPGDEAFKMAVPPARTAISGVYDAYPQGPPPGPGADT
ncbi:hypothetical protein OG285_01120 [Streptomyces sp. NBC_01471]|uniref:MHYT domain-containing protein n=1 Tax=Streptomyces sp. NBC_01471 TaxID=2903879 RepID=UPI00325246B2